MDTFETNLNNMLVSTFNYILRFEEISLKAVSNGAVTVTDAHVLEAIGRKNGGATISQIAKAMSFSLPSATVAVKKLQSKGFIIKSSCEQDARRFIVSLTNKGKQINRVHNLFHKKMVRNISKIFSNSEKEILLSAIDKLNDFFKKKVSA